MLHQAMWHRLHGGRLEKKGPDVMGLRTTRWLLKVGCQVASAGKRVPRTPVQRRRYA